VIAHDRRRGVNASPGALANLPESRVIRVDVREDIRRGHEPLAKIMRAVEHLGTDQVLLLRAPFEPTPLYALLGKRGFGHTTERQGPDDWWVWFHRELAHPSPTSPPTGPADAAASHRDELLLDVRRLEPPEPMLRVLEALDRLPPGARLVVHHDRRPVFLYPQLEGRGFAHETDEPEPGLVRIVIRRRAHPS